MEHWYVTRTKCSAEHRAVWNLNNQGFTTYLPRYRKQIRHARKTQTVLRPLFPGYVFVRMDAEQPRLSVINNTFGVIGLVQFGSEPQSIPAAMVEAIRSREDETGAVSLAPDGLKKGDRVRFLEGAFIDYTALLEEISDDKRAILLIDLMGRAIRISAPMEHLSKAS